MPASMPAWCRCCWAPLAWLSCSVPVFCSSSSHGSPSHRHTRRWTTSDLSVATSRPPSFARRTGRGCFVSEVPGRPVGATDDVGHGAPRTKQLLALRMLSERLLHARLEFRGRQIFEMRGERPVVAEGVGHGPVTVAPEHIL